MSEKTLTAEGARLLRIARDRIVAHPDEYDKGNWGCETEACIAGHVCLAAGERDLFGAGQKAVELLGFGQHEYVAWAPKPIRSLFLDDAFTKFRRDVHKAAADINAFLWAYGYPPNELSEQPEAVGAVARTDGIVAGGPRA